jgi:hypothetical protein
MGKWQRTSRKAQCAILESTHVRVDPPKRDATMAQIAAFYPEAKRLLVAAGRLIEERDGLMRALAGEPETTGEALAESRL